MTPNAVVAVPPMFAICCATAITTAINAIIASTIQVIGQARSAAFNPYCAAVSASVAPVAIAVAAALTPSAIAIAPLIAATIIATAL